MPAAENVAVESTAEESPNVTVPGPDCFDQVVVTVAGGLGRPSSLIVPSNSVFAGMEIVWSLPALTVGARFVPAVGLTVMVTSSVLINSLSLPVSLRTYVPNVEKVAVVSTTDESSNVTVPGPESFDQVVVTVAGGSGSPSSVTVPSSQTSSTGNVIV